MTLRRQILLFLLLFGLIPLAAVVLLNMPMIVGQVERFYHEAHLQNLRADFRDIDQHIASRNETVRLLAKLPEPGLLQTRQSEEGFELSSERDLYLAWLDRVLRDQLDITSILFLDTQGTPLWRLKRDQASGFWRENTLDYEPINADFISNSLNLPPGRSIAGPIHHKLTVNGNDDLFLRLTSPVYEYDFKPPVGTVVINIDVGGLAHAYRQTYWVFDNGEYLRDARPTKASENAFTDFPGLDEIFNGTKAALWNPRDSDPVIWIPMFPTNSGKPLWVGRQVDPSPLTLFRNQLTIRVLGIIAVLVLAVWFVARLIAKKIETYQRELTNSLQQTLSGKEMVPVPVRGPGELKDMAATLNQLAEKHANNNLALRKHAAELESSNRYKSQFLANVSHELRTPLNSVLLLSKILSDDDNPPLTAEQRQQACVIHKAGTDLKNMIDNILDLSRIEARRCNIMVESVALPALLEEIREIVAPQFKAKHLELDLIIDRAIPDVIISDSEKIGQVVKNFLSNAVKFTKSGTVQFMLSQDRENAEQPIKICVIDPGRGIPEDQQAHIFEAFQQADGSTNRLYGGTGLGLTISRELARLIGGKISLQSAAAKGSTFCLHLPLKIEAIGEQVRIEEEEVSDAREVVVATEPRKIAPKPDHQGRRAMVIDSDFKAMLNLTGLLENQGFEVTGALDKSEAMENLDEEHYDIVISGINLSSTQQQEWMEKLQKQTSGAATVFVTAGDQAIESTHNPDLLKPIDADQVASLLKAHFGKDS